MAGVRRQPPFADWGDPGAVSARKQKHPAGLFAPLVLLALGTQPKDRRCQPIPALEPLPARCRARLQKMLAPFRPFAVPFGATRQSLARAVYSLWEEGPAGRDGVRGEMIFGHV